MEDLELILHPMVEEGKEAVGSMGDDTPLAVLSDQYRGLHHFFRQNFSQVTNPPIDSLRERRVMTLSTRLGNLGNILDEDETQCRHAAARLAGAARTGVRRRCAPIWASSRVEIDCTFDPGTGGDGGAALRDALRASARGRGRRARRLRARDPHRQGAGHRPRADPDDPRHRRACTRTSCASSCAPSPRSTCARRNASTRIIFAVLIGVGATTVNAYLAQEAIADRHAAGCSAAEPARMR